ncbi:hypothetical protein HDU98_010733 [Podochytrium sp. JEL0797]|nr:hypothetical protein HDU98_010733 [Podochytrium sp. JEL0797]
MSVSPTARLLRLLPSQSLPLSPAMTLPGQHSQSFASQQINTALSVRALLAANAHLGHAAETQHAAMVGFVHGTRGGVSVINLEHTLAALRRACGVAAAVGAAGAAPNVVFVASRRALHAVAADAALACGAAFVTKWVGGTLTNRERVLKRAVRFDPDRVTQLVQMQDENGDVKVRQPRVKLPDLIVLLDMNNNYHAVREANQLNIPIIAIADSDCDPTLVQYPIPANDDSLSSVGLIAGLLANAVREGAALHAARPPPPPSNNNNNNNNNNKRSSNDRSKQYQQ